MMSSGECRICNHVFLSKTARTLHMRNVHQQRVMMKDDAGFASITAAIKMGDQFVCAVCSETLASVQTVRRHYVRFHGCVRQNQPASVATAIAAQSVERPSPQLCFAVVGSTTSASCTTTEGEEDFILGWTKKLSKGDRALLFPKTVLPDQRSSNEEAAKVILAGTRYMAAIHWAIERSPDLLLRQLAGTAAHARHFQELQQLATRVRYARFASSMLWFARKVAAEVSLDEQYADDYGDGPDGFSSGYAWFPPELLAHALAPLPDGPLALEEYMGEFLRLCFFVHLDVTKPDTDFFFYIHLMLVTMNASRGYVGQVETIKQALAKMKFLIRGTVLLAMFHAPAPALPAVKSLASCGLSEFVSDANEYHTPYQTLRLLSASLSCVASEKQAMQVIWLLGEGGRLQYDALRVAATGAIISWQRQLQPLAHRLLAQVRDAASAALMGLEPAAALGELGTISDDLARVTEGYWGGESVLHPVNPRLPLLDHFLRSDCLYPLFVARGGVGGAVWRIGQLQTWLSGPVRALETALLTMFHVTAGMPARATEYPALLLRNTSTQKRSVMWFKSAAHEQRLLVMQRYHKTRAVLQTDKPVPRFVVRELQLWASVYLLLIRPLIDVLPVEVFDGRLPSKADFKQFLFAFSRSPDDVRAAYQSSLGRAQFPVALSMSSYRHVAQAYAEVLLPGEGEQQAGDVGRAAGSTHLNAQMGHSSTTGSLLYARSQLQLPNTAPLDFARYYKLSVGWGVALLGDAAGEAQGQGQGQAEGQELELELDQQQKNGASSSVQMRPQLTVSLGLDEQQELAVSASQLPSPLYLPRSAGAGLAVSSAGLMPSQRSLTQAHNWTRKLQQAFGDTDSPVEGGGGCFRSSEQAVAVGAVMQRHCDVLAVLATGGGKSLLFLVPALAEMENGWVTVVVVPLLALGDDLTRRCREAGIPCLRWRGESVLNGEDVGHGLPAGICVVDVSRAGAAPFLAVLSRTAQRQRLSRIVFDEVHLIQNWAHFRARDMSVGIVLAAQPSCSDVPFVLLTATLPPGAQQALTEQRFGIRRLLTVRGCTDRPNLRYCVAELQSGALGDIASAIVGCLICYDALVCSSSGSRVLVYVNARKTAEELAVAVSGLGGGAAYVATSYHADMDGSKQADAVCRWRSGAAPVMVCTSAFSCGVDYASVRLVIHVGLPPSLADYAQECGRAGRDGGAAVCQLFLLPTDAAAPHRGGGGQDMLPQLSEEAQKIRRWAFNRSACRRLTLQVEMDGDSYHAQGPCGLYMEETRGPRRELCDICEGDSGDADTPANAGLRLASRQAMVSSSFTAARAAAASLEAVLRTVAQSQVCGFCYLLGVDAFAHAVEECPVIGASMCHGCGRKGVCRGGACGMRESVAAARQNFSLCSRCHLPASVGGVDLHARRDESNIGEEDAAFMMFSSCTNGGGRFMWKLAMHCFVVPRLRASVLAPLFDQRGEGGKNIMLMCQRAFASWLVDCAPASSGLSNIAYLILHLEALRRSGHGGGEGITFL